MQNPLFVPSYSSLLKKLRLSAIAADPIPQDVIDIVDEAIINARMSFIERLSIPRIDKIVADGGSYTTTPSTNQAFLLTLAASTEVKLVRCELLYTLPQAYMDASGDLSKRWNVEAPFREMDVRDVEAARLVLDAQIEKAMEFLAGEDIVVAESLANVWNGTPIDPTPRLGDSLQRLPVFDQSGDLQIVVLDDPNP